MVKQQSTSLESSHVSFFSAVFGEKYRRATVICFIINIFNQYTGVSPIIMYAGRLIERFNEEAALLGTEFPISPLAGSMIIGLTSSASTILAYYLISYFGRRTLLVSGQIGVALPLFAAGVCLIYEYAITSFILICSFIFVYQFTLASVAWLYIPEVTVDKATGFCMTSQFIFMLQLSLTFEYQLSSIGIQGNMWLFGGVSLLGFLFMLLFVKESRGLTDRQKKQLYLPKGASTTEFIAEMTQSTSERLITSRVAPKVAYSV